MGQGDSRQMMLDLSVSLTQSSTRCVAWHQSLCDDENRICEQIRVLPETRARDLLTLARQLQSVRAQKGTVEGMLARLHRLQTSAGSVHHQIDLEQAMGEVTRGIQQIERAMGHPAQIIRAASEFESANSRLQARRELVSESLNAVAADEETGAVGVGATGLADVEVDADELANLVVAVRTGEDGGGGGGGGIGGIGGIGAVGSSLGVRGIASGVRGGGAVGNRRDAAATALADAMALRTQQQQQQRPPVAQPPAAPVPVRRVVAPILTEELAAAGAGAVLLSPQKRAAEALVPGVPAEAEETVDAILAGFPSVPR